MCTCFLICFLTQGWWSEQNYAATHFPDFSVQEMRGLEIRWKQNLEKRRKEEEEVTCFSGGCGCFGWKCPLISHQTASYFDWRPGKRGPRVWTVRYGVWGKQIVTSSGASNAWRVILPNLGWLDFTEDNSKAESDKTHGTPRVFDVVWYCLALIGHLYTYMHVLIR